MECDEESSRCLPPPPHLPTAPSPVERHQSNGQVVLRYVPFTLRFLADRAKGRTLSQCQHIVGDLILPIVWHLFMDALHSLRQVSVIGGRVS